MTDLFCEPTAEQRAAKSGLIGKRISLWWDGDAVFFPAKVIDYDAAAGIHNVRYENDETLELYPEVLTKQPWKIWTGGEEQFKAYNKLKVEVQRMVISETQTKTPPSMDVATILHFMNYLISTTPWTNSLLISSSLYNNRKLMLQSYWKRKKAQTQRVVVTP